MTVTATSCVIRMHHGARADRAVLQRTIPGAASGRRGETAKSAMLGRESRFYVRPWLCPGPAVGATHHSPLPAPRLAAGMQENI